MSTYRVVITATDEDGPFTSEMFFHAPSAATALDMGADCWKGAAEVSKMTASLGDMWHDRHCRHQPGAVPQPDGEWAACYTLAQFRDLPVRGNR